MARRVSALEALSAEIIRRVQPEQDGGLFSFFEANDPLKRPGNNFFLDFLKNCTNKGTYQTALVLGSVWALLIPFLVTCFLIVWCCRKCCSKCNARTKACRSFSNFLARTWVLCFPSKQLEDRKAKLAVLFSCLRSAPRIRMPDDPRGRVLKALCGLVTILLILFAIAILLSFAAHTPLRAAMDEPSSPSSARGIIDRTLDAFERFVVRAVSESRNTTTDVIDDFAVKLQRLIRLAVGTFTGNLLFDYGVKTLFATAKRVTTDIENVLEAMAFIKDSQNNIFVRYHEFNGFVNTYRDLLESLAKVCALSMSASQRKECQRLSVQRKLLEVNIQQSKINFDSSTSLLFILREMQVNISSIANDIRKANATLEEQLSGVYISIQKDFNLNVIFGSLDTIWEMATNSSNNMLLIPISNMRNGSVNNAIGTASLLWKIVIGLFGYIMLLMIIFAICFLFMVIPKWSGSKREQNYVVDTLVSNDSRRELLKEEQSRSVPVRLFTSFGIFFGFFIVLPAAVVVFSFYAGSITENEICRYSKSDGLSQLNDIVDRYVATHWSRWTRSLDIDLNGIPLELPVPQGIIEAITGSCVNDSQRLMQAVGFTNILNVSQLLGSPMFTKMLSSGKDLSKKMIAKLDIDKMIPVSFTKVLREAVNLTNMMVDQVDYQSSIHELRKPLLKLDNYTKFVLNLKAFTNSLLPAHKGNSDLDFIVKLVDPMERKVGEYHNLTHLLGKVRMNFEVLNRTRRISSGLTKLLEEFDAALVILNDKKRMVKAVDPIFDGVMSWAVPEIANVTTNAFKKLERELLPCDDLADAFNTATKGVCEDLLPPLNAFILSYGWCVVCFQLLFLSLWLLLKKVRRQQQQKDSSDC